MTDPTLLRFIVMPVVGVALGIRDGRLDAAARTKPLQYKVWPFLKATALPFFFMTTINIVAQAASPQRGVNPLEAIGFAGLCVGVLYTLSRNVTNQLVSRQRAPAVSKPGGYGFARMILAIYCVAGVVTIVFVARGSTTVSTKYGHVMGEQHQIASEVPGRVAEVLVNDNQRVEAGQPLVRIEDDRYQALVRLARGALAGAESMRDAAAQRLAILRVTTQQDIRQARADLASAEARLRQAQLGVEIAEAIDQRAAATVDVASANLALLEFQKVQIARSFATDPGSVPLVRKKSSETFFDSGTAAVSATEAMKSGALTGVDLARQLVVIAQQQVEMKQADLQQAHTGPEQVKAAEATLAAAESSVVAARAKLEKAELNLGYCTIYTPSDGDITHRSVEVGNFVRPQQPLMAVSGLDRPYVMAKFREPDLSRIKPGQTVDLVVDAYPDSPLRGTVDSLNPGTVGAESLFPPSNATGQFVKYIQRTPVKITIPAEQLDADRPLVMGMNVNVTIIDPEPSQRTFN